MHCLLCLPARSPWDGTGLISFKSANLGAFRVPGAHQNPADASVWLKNVLPRAEPVEMVLGSLSLGAAARGSAHLLCKLPREPDTKKGF